MNQNKVAKFIEEKKKLFLTSFDLKKFFDMENLYNCFNQLYKLKVRGKVYKMLHEMNKNITIKVNTPVGLTEAEETGPGIAQGAVDAAAVSSANVAGGVAVI